MKPNRKARAYYLFVLNSALISAIIGAGVNLFDGYQSRRDSRLQQLLSLSGHFDNDMRQIRRDTAKSLLNDKSPDYDEVMDFFDTVGLLVEQGAIDKTLTWSMFSYQFDRYFQKAAPFMESERQTEHDPTLWENVYKLNEAMVEVERKRRGESYVPNVISQKDLEEYLDGEMKLSIQRG